MTRIVYAADNYTPRPGEVVLPIHEHPSVAEDKHYGFGQQKKWTRRKPVPIPPVRAAIVEYLQQVGGATTIEIASAIGRPPSSVSGIICRHSYLFEPIGEQPSPTQKGRVVTVWGLVTHE